MSTVSVPTAHSGAYAIDRPRSRIGFAVHSLPTKVRGSFNEFDGTGWFDVENPADSKLTLTVSTASITTRNARRDAHLRSKAFFEVETYPTLTFVSTKVDQTGDALYRVTGDLTIKGVTKPVTLDFRYTGRAFDRSDASDKHRIGFEGKTTLNRKDWGVNWNAALEGGGIFIGKMATIAFEVSAVRIDADEIGTQ
jgi:polyisoprenoid-binding protein YceI